mmetsp:Transcript_25600/g.48802  ORF Transcript_25600/g.48802 Transcript_25600/m.48802 type:complete len:320 (+) Transcript_25600:123-1082(+)
MRSFIRRNLRHGTSLSAEVSLGTLGKLGVKHGGVTGKSNTSKDEESKGKLLSSRGAGSASKGGASSRNNNFSGLVVVSSLEGADEVADKLFVADLVVVVIVVDNTLLKSVAGFALASGLVKLLAHLVDLNFLLVITVVLVLILFFVLNKTGGNALSLSEGLLEEVVRKLHVVSIIILHIVLNVLGLVVVGTLLVSEDTNLDAGSRRGTHGTGVVNITVVVLVIELLALSEFTGIHVAILLHVLNILALRVTAGGVHVLALVGILVLLGGIVIGLSGFSGLLVTLVTGLAILLLDLLFVSQGSLKVSVHVHDVLSVVVVT